MFGQKSGWIFWQNYLESLFMRLSKTIFFAWFFEFFAIHSCSLKILLFTNRNFSYKYHRKLNYKVWCVWIRYGILGSEFQSAIFIPFWDALDFTVDSILTVFEIRWRIGHHIYHRKRSVQKQRSGTLFQTEKIKINFGVPIFFLDIQTDIFLNETKMESP